MRIKREYMVGGFVRSLVICFWIKRNSLVAKPCGGGCRVGAMEGMELEKRYSVRRGI
jgi:hypothetical protein